MVKAIAALGVSIALLFQSPARITREQRDTGVGAGKRLRDAVLLARGKLIIPPGLYVLTSTITIFKPNLVIECASGAIIEGASSSVSPLIKLDAPNTAVRGCQFRGQAEDGRTRQAAVEIGKVTNASVTDNFIGGTDSSHGFNNGVQIDSGGSGEWIERNTIQQLFGTGSGLGYGILLIATNRNHVYYNHILFSATQGRHQIYVTQNSSYNKIVGNILEGGTDSMISVFARDSQGDGARYNEICANILRDGGNSIYATGAIGLFNNVSHTFVLDNVVSGTARTPGIEVWDAGGKTKPPTSNIVTNNRIENTGTFGIEIVGASRNKIIGNRIHNSGRLAANKYDGVLIAGDGGSLHADNNEVRDNYIYNSGHYSLNILSAVPRATATIVNGNTFEGSPTGAYNDSGVGTILENNSITEIANPLRFKTCRLRRKSAPMSHPLRQLHLRDRNTPALFV